LPIKLRFAFVIEGRAVSSSLSLFHVKIPSGQLVTVGKKYKIDGERYNIYLLSENGKSYLSLSV
jgi:hypothetical protein